MCNMMKLKIGSTLLLAAVLVGCNDDEEVTTAPEEAPTEQSVTDAVTNTDDQNTDDQNTNTATETPFNFSGFSLDVDYSVTESYEVEYDNETTGVEASIEDDRDKSKVTGDDAYAKLEPIFKQFTFDANTANEDVLKEVMTAFSIGDDYQSVEIEVKFADGAEKEYSLRK